MWEENQRGKNEIRKRQEKRKGKRQGKGLGEGEKVNEMFLFWIPLAEKILGKKYV